MKSKLAALALVGIVSTGCGSSGEPARAEDTGRATAVTFSNCMRENGVTAFPDPDASGELTADGVANNSRINTNGSAWTRAMTACKDLEPAGFTGSKRSAAQQATSLKFAQCIRENGVDDFPDPDPNGPLIDTNRIPSLSGDNADLAELNAAMKTCGEVYAEDLGLSK